MGEFIYEYVEQIAGPNAPKVTGMLIDLPLNEIVEYLQNFEIFLRKVQEASTLIGSQGQ